MKITADFEGRNDEYDDDVIRYYENHDNDEYFYEIYILADGKKSRVVVTEHGVSVDFFEGGTIHTNMVPNRMFPGIKKLEWKHLVVILKLLETTDMEGKFTSSEEMQSLYEYWKKNIKDN